MRPPRRVPAASFIPRDVVHRFKNVSGITGRMLGWSLPGGQDHYLKAISELAAGGGFTSEKVMEISRTFVPTSLSSPESSAISRASLARQPRLRLSSVDSLSGH